MEYESSWWQLLNHSLKGTALDILPIIGVLVFFQLVAIRKKLPHFKKICTGFILVIVGLGIFIVGLEQCIFPLGTEMANQLTDVKFLVGEGKNSAEVFSGESPPALLYIWTYIFAFFIGFSTTLAEPSLIAVALKAKEISTGAISAWGLRIAVAFGVAFGVALGTYRIVTGTPLYIYILSGYIILLIQTIFAPKLIIPLAYDSGGVTTSTVTVPLVAALGIGLASNVPGRSPLLDGFGLIAFASLFPIMAVLAYAKITEILSQRNQNNYHHRGSQ